MYHLIKISDLTKDKIASLIELANDIETDRRAYSKVCEDASLASLFFEPSTRTRLSFEAAMLELGGKVLGFADASTSSAAKGESVADTIRVVECYSDIIVMRHPKEGAPYAASRKASVPIINAGDGGHNHPTQTLTDLHTIMKAKGRLGGITIGLCGDLMFGRTVHSLVEALSMYDDVHFVLISPEELRAPDYLKEGALNKPNVTFVETESLDESISGLDVLYMTRVQRERFFNEADYVRLKDRYCLTLATLKRASRDLAVLHPLPRVNEIAPEVDDTEGAWYFKQAMYGKHIRKALIMDMLEARR